jgi:hypothetical protein
MVTIPASSLDIQVAIANQRAFFATGKTNGYDFRVAQLNKLSQLI